MRKREVTLPQLFLIAGTRVALGIGVGLLISNRLNSDQKRAAGLALVAVGALTTIPLAVSVLNQGAKAISEEAA